MFWQKGTLSMQNKTTRNVLHLFVVLTCAVALHPKAIYAQGTVLTVNVCTESELQATINAAVDGDTIVFGCTGVINVTTPLTIGSNITLDGAGTITLDGGGTTTILFVSIGATLNNLTFQNGFSGNGPGGGAINGGGFASVPLTINNSTFINNVADTTSFGSGGGGAIYTVTGALNDPNAISLVINNSTFINNRAVGPAGSTGGGALYISTGRAIVNSSNFSGNTAAGSGGAIDLRFFSADPNRPFTLDVNGSVFTNNTAQTGGAVRLNSISTVNNSKFLGNQSTGAPASDAVEIAASGVPTISNSCFVGNGIALDNGSANPVAAQQNWWGVPSGPSGLGTGDGDAVTSSGGGNVDFSNLIALPTFPDFQCPTVVPDFYTIPIGQTLSVTAANGLLANDIGVQPNMVTLDTAADFGTLALNPDGSFTYTPDTPTEPVDGFRYRALDLDGAPFIGLVCITRTNLQVTVPPTQTTTVNTPIPIPNLSVQGAAPQTQVRVELRVNLGTIDTGFANAGAATIPPSQECSDLLEQIRMASVPQAPSIVDTGASATNELMRYSGSVGFVPYFQQQQPPPGVTIQGNGTNNVIIEGPLSGVNTVLANVTYVSPTVGVDNLVIVANDGVGSVATGQVVIIINGGAPPTAGGGGGNGGDDAATGGSAGEGDTTVAIAAPLGPLTLFEISQIPGTVVRGESSTSTVQNGDVFVRVIATNGTLQVGTEQIGDPTLLQLPIFNGAEVFGLTFGGVPVQDFGGRVKLCLLGVGTFYYRDATAMPRTTVILPTTLENGFTCALIPNAGTVILVADGTNTVPPAPETVNIAERRTLPPGCMVTTDAIINLRETPSIADNIIRRVPFNVTLTAFEQDGNWYFVDYLGQRGWMSADFVTPNQRC